VYSIGLGLNIRKVLLITGHKEYCIRVVSIYVYIIGARQVGVYGFYLCCSYSGTLLGCSRNIYWSEMQVSLGKVFMGLVTIGYVLFFSIS
jgi:hypothetical protein